MRNCNAKEETDDDSDKEDIIAISDSRKKSHEETIIIDSKKEKLMEQLEQKEQGTAAAVPVDPDDIDDIREQMFGDGVEQYLQNIGDIEETDNETDKADIISVKKSWEDLLNEVNHNLDSKADESLEYGDAMESENGRDDDITQTVAEIKNDLQQAHDAQWINPEDEESDWDDELEEAKSRVEFSHILKMRDVTGEKLLAAINDSGIGKEAEKLLSNARQEIKEASPYRYGKRVIDQNRLCCIQSVNADLLLHIFNGKCWTLLDEEALKQLVYNSLPESMKLTAKGIEGLIGNIASFVKREMKKSYDEGQVRFCKSDYADIANHIVFNNGVFDVVSGKLRGFSSRKPYYYVVNCDYLPEDLETPYYDQFKMDATGGDEESMEMFDLMQAYLLIPNRTGKCFFIMSYAKDSGKTSFGEFIEGYFPDESVYKLDTDNLGEKFSYAGYDKALLISCLEMSTSGLTKKAAKALKNFTGESKIEVEAKYQNHITAPVRFKTLLASNGGLYLPPGESDDAFYRRAIVIPFIHSTPLDKLKADLPQKWEEERSAIISKCVRKLKSIMRTGECIRFPESALSKEIKAQWSGKSLINEKFVRDAIVFTANEDDAIPKQDLKMVYDMFYSENILGLGSDRPIQCSKDQLVKLINTIYPSTKNAKRRRTSIKSPKESNLEQCVVGIRWAEKYRNFIAENFGNED